MHRLVLLLVLALPITAYAQPSVDAPVAASSTKGFFLHARLGAYGASFEDTDDDGGGGGLRAGYGVSERVKFYLGVEGAELDGSGNLEGLHADDQQAMAYVELGSRFLFRPGRRLMPFSDVAVSVMGIGNDDIIYGGAGLSLGGGVLYFLTPRLALESSLAVTPGRFQEREADGVTENVDVHVTGTRLHIGVTFYPFR